MSRFINPVVQYLSDSGDPLIEGELTIYNTGTSNKKDLFFDVNLSIEAPNPVILTGAGRLPNTFFSGSARVVLRAASIGAEQGTQIFDVDPVSADQLTAAFSSWNAITIYNKLDIVTGPDGLRYESIVNDNQGSEPSATPTDWTEIRFIRIYNPNESYTVNQVAQGSDGLLYSSRNAGLLADPTVSIVDWRPAATVNSSVYDSPEYWLGV